MVGFQKYVCVQPMHQNEGDSDESAKLSTTDPAPTDGKVLAKHVQPPHPVSYSISYNLLVSIIQYPYVQARCPTSQLTDPEQL